MSYLIGFGIFLLGFFGSLFALSNVLLPLFYSLPRFREEKEKGSFKGNPTAGPLFSLVAIWSAIYIILIAVVIYFLLDYTPAFLVGSVLALVGNIKKLRDKSPDLEEDFRDRYQEYWK